MNFEELSKIVANDTGMKVCEICGVAFRPVNDRQKVCGDADCQREATLRRAREYRKKRMAEDPEGFRAYRRAATRKSRAKKKKLEKSDEDLIALQDKYRKMEESERKLSEWGLAYGKRQMEQTLASVPKIDVEGFLKGVNDGKLQQADRRAGRGSEEARSESKGDQQTECDGKAEDTVLRP
jgi:hypothetical protein